MKDPLKFLLYEKNGKRYLIVVLAGLKGEKVKRRFEIITEVDKENNPVEFKGIKIDD